MRISLTATAFRRHGEPDPVAEALCLDGHALWARHDKDANLATLKCNNGFFSRYKAPYILTGGYRSPPPLFIVIATLFGLATTRTKRREIESVPALTKPGIPNSEERGQKPEGEISKELTCTNLFLMLSWRFLWRPWLQQSMR